MTSIVEQPRDSPDAGEQTKGEVKIPSETLTAFGGDELRARVFYEKYALRDADGIQTEKRPEDMWRRVARELASPEMDNEKKKEWASKFYWLLEDWRFVPGGRILFGAGQSRKSTLLNCYFFKIREDSIESIFDWCKEAARTYSFGGGVGTDISVLRPKGAPVNNSAIYSSGSVSFMELLSTTTGTIGQAGRRGALMITIRVDHPDVMDFINVKRDLKRVNYANISVKITDDFMRAVETDGDFLLHFKNEKAEMSRIVRARDVWKSLIKGAWQSAEPGVLFWDAIKRESTTEYNGMEVQGVNPCVTGDTLVRTPTGWRRADSLSAGEPVVTAYGSVKPITEITRTEGIDVYRVEFSDGSTIDVSPGHIFHSRKGQPRGAPEFNKFWSNERRLTELAVGDSIRLGKIDAPPQNEVETHGIPDRDFGFMVGVLLGDGSISEAVVGRGQAKVASDKREAEWNARLVVKFSAIAPNIAISADARSNSCYIYLYKDGTDFVTQNTLLRPAKSSAKEIPVEYLNSNRAFHSGLIDGLFSTDGDVDLNPSNPCLRLSSTSRRLLEQTRLILQFYGINGRIYRSAEKGKTTIILGRTVTLNHDAYHLNIYGSDFKHFREIFSLTHPDKQRKLQKIKDMVAGSVSDSTKVKSITYMGKATVYDIYEKETDTWITNGYVSRGCSEQTLESYGCCCLGSVNLSAFVKDPFTEKASIDWDQLTRATQYGVRFLDNVLDYNAERHPLAQQKDASLWSRRIGVGITGLGDMLIKLGLKYDEDSTIGFVDHLFERIKNVIYDYSTELAKEKGSFPAFDAEKHLAQPFISRLDDKVKEKIRTQGIRNAAVTTIPPVGSGSILAGTSSGVEPVFALFYTRRSKSLSEGEFKVFHPLVREYMAATGARDEGQLPNYFLTAHQIRPEMRVMMQATIQKHIDTAISSCLTGDAMIFTSEGPRILKDLVSKNDSAPGFHAHNLTVINEDGEEKKSDSYFVNGAHPVKSVRTFGNRTIRGTPNHRVRVLDPNYNIVWKRLDQLTLNDWVVGRVGLGAWGSNERSIRRIVGKRFGYERHTNSKKITWPVRPTKELGRFLGYVVADGGINRNGVSISMRDDDSCFDDCVGLPKEIFGLETYVSADSRSPHLQRITVNSRELVAWLGYVGLEGDCYTKEVPKVILGAGRGTVKEFIRGVTHDGYVSNSSVNVVGVTNERLAIEIMYLLENFGVVSTLQVEEKTGQHMVWQGQATSYVLQNVYHVVICGHEARKYVDMIGFAQEEKQSKAEKVFGNRDDRIVPYGSIPDYGLRKRFREQTLPRIKNLGLYRHFHSLSSSKNRQTIGRDTVTAMSDLGLQVPKYLTDPTYVFHKVEEIDEEGMAHTFDLSVPQGNNYIANGLVCHNTVNLPEEITPEEVEKIYLLAWKMKCKGITVYREGSREGILETEKVAKKAEVKAPTLFERPKVMEGRTLKLKLPQGSIYLTANLVEGEIKEVFVTLGKSGADENADAAALGRLISLYLQHGGDIKNVISTLKGIKGKYVSWDEGTQLQSIPDAIAKALERLTLNHVVKESGFTAEAKSIAAGGTCPDCHENTLVFENGCYHCSSCGYSKCE